MFVDVVRNEKIKYRNYGRRCFIEKNVYFVFVSSMTDEIYVC